MPGGSGPPGGGIVQQMCDFGALNILSKKLDIFFKNPLTISIIRDIIETPKQITLSNNTYTKGSYTMKNIINTAKHLANGNTALTALFVVTLTIDYTLAPVYRVFRIF